MKSNKILTLCAAAFLCAATLSCSDDEVQTPLSATQGNNGEISYNYLTFKWNEVAGATQYGYELTDGDERVVIQDVTQSTQIRISGLEPDTEYTFKVWSYAAIGSGYTTSDPVVMKATTLPVEEIASPELTTYNVGEYYYVAWDAVDHADSYSYSLISGDEVIESGEVARSPLEFSGLAEGAYVVSVQALTSQGGYSDGKATTATFEVGKKEIWRVTGNYYSEVFNESWTAVLVAYSNGSYSLLGWSGVEGYDLDFSINTMDPDDSFVISGGYDYDPGSGCYSVPTGRSDMKSIYVYPWYNYSGLSGDKSEGEIWLCVYGSDYVYDSFQWSSATLTMTDKLAGTWHMDTYGENAINDYWEWEDFSFGEDVEIKKLSENTVSLPAFMFADEIVTAVVDPENNTLTIEPATVWVYYTLAGSADDTTPLVGTYNSDGTIEFSGYCAWYDGYKYVRNGVAKFTRID